MTETKTVLIVGAGQAGGQVARQLLANGYANKILLAGDEAHLPYERPPLSKSVLKGVAGEDSIFFGAASDWDHPQLEIAFSDRIAKLDMSAKLAFFISGRSVAFDTLVMATGGGPRVPNIPGAERALTLRNLDDSRALRAELRGARRIAIIGGGVIGMEVAATAAGLGCTTTVIEAGPRTMARVLPPVASTWLQDLHRAQGSRILTNAVVERIEQGADGLRVCLQDDEIDCDVVLLAIGIVPNTHLLPAGVIGPARGILTDEHGRVPGYEGVFAVGDVAESYNALYGRPVRLETWRNADRQARAIAQTICGVHTAHCETPWMWSDQLDRNIQVVGLWQDDAEVVVRGRCGDPGSIVFWLKNDVLTGGMLVDSGRDRRFLEKMVEVGLRPSPLALADPSLPLKSLI